MFKQRYGPKNTAIPFKKQVEPQARAQSNDTLPCIQLFNSQARDTEQIEKRKNHENLRALWKRIADNVAMHSVKTEMQVQAESMLITFHKVV